MGVHGLWRLIEPSGKPVPLETLENKTLAVDISIWLHQAVKGFQDSKGAPLPNAHLLGIFHRVCKLLYFRIRPVFVFDGGVPILKKETIAKRNQSKTRNFNEANRIQKQLLRTLLKHSAVNKVISEKTKATIESIEKDLVKSQRNDAVDDLYKLPPSELEASLSSSDDDYTTDTTESSSPSKTWDLHTIDEKSTQFKSLPVDIRHDILTELKETRKQSSWGRIHELPTHSDDFSIYQMNRLLKRHSVQISLEETEKEMGGHILSLGELEALLNDHGVITSNETIGSRIASNENVRYLLIKDVKKAMEKAINDENIKAKSDTSDNINQEGTTTTATKDEKIKNSEFEKDLKQAIQLSLLDVPSTSKSDIKESTQTKIETTTHTEQEQSYFEKFNDADFQSDSSEYEDNLSNKVLTSAKNYMTEYSGLTQSEIAKIIDNKSQKTKPTLLDTNKKELVKKQDVPMENISIESKAKNEVETKKNLVEVISDTESSSESDFLEVEDGVSEDNINNLEIVVKPTDNLDDDLFGDIFNKSNTNINDRKHDLINNEKITNISNAHLKDIGNFSDEIKVIDDKTNKTSNCENDSGNNPIEVIKVIDNVNNTEIKRSDINEEVKESLLHEIVRDNVHSSLENEKKINLSTKQLEEMKLNLMHEENELISERATKERLASNITDQMYQEAQELLQLFGLPYVIAPMEAEAQCAFLDEINLTDGTITDDSDIWLFGGKTVYKNFFNQNKRVMEFKSENIFHSFRLSRYEMILLALLVGSDYTTGLQGIGPVTALEILAVFPPKKLTKVCISQDQLITGLKEFQKWFKEGNIPGPSRTTLRNKLKNVKISENFPSLQVVQAYLEPTVDSSNENFSWGKPDIVGLMDFAKEKFGWNRTKSEEILKPVIKRMEETFTQKKITNYFRTKHKIDSQDVENKMSKRVKTAVKKIAKETHDLSTDEDVKVLKETKKRSRRKVKKIENEIKEIEKEIKNQNPEIKVLPNLHKKETIPQKQKDSTDALRKKMKAIEVFRKSKQGPGYAKKRQKISKTPKEDAMLSENSNSS